MLSSFDVNPRWSREAEAEAAAGKQEQQHSSNDGTSTRPDTNTTMPHRMDAHDPHEDMLDVPGAHSTPSPTNGAAAPKRTSSASRQKAQRRGSWCIDMPVMEGDHAGGVRGMMHKPADNSHPAPPPSPPGRAEVSNPESSGSQLDAGSSDKSDNHADRHACDVGGVTASSMSDIYERARKNLFGTGGGLEGGSSSGGGSRRSSSGSGDSGDAWDLSTGPTTSGGGPDAKFSASHGSSTHQPSPTTTTTTSSSAALPAWMKDKLRKDRLRREESSRSRLSNTSTSGNSSSSDSRGPAPTGPPVRSVSTEEFYRKADDRRRSSSFRRQPRSSSYNVPLHDDSDDDDVDDVFPNDHHQHLQHVDYTIPLSTSSRSNSTEDLVSRPMSNEQLARKERRSKSAWGGNHSGKTAKRRASEGDIAKDDADDHGHHSDGDVSSKSFADRLEDLYDELDGEKGADVPSPTRMARGAHPRRASSSDIHPTGDNPNGSAKSLDCDLEAAIVRRSREAGQLGHSGRFAAPRAPTRRGSNRNLQDIDFELDDDLNDASGDLSGDFGGDKPPRYDPGMASSSPNDEESSSTDVNNHNSASNRRDNNRSQRSFRIMFNTHGESHLEPTKNQFGNTFGDVDFNPLNYKDYTSNAVHIRRQRRMNWCRVATVVMAACTIVLAAMTAYQKLGLPWSSNSPASSSTTEPSIGAVIGLDDASSTRADWATDWSAPSSVKLPAHIESNLADWTSFAPAVEGQRRDQNYKVQRMNDEIPPDEEEEKKENQSTSTPLLWTIPFSGSTVTEEVFGQCLHLVQTSDLGVSNGHDSDDSLSVQQIRGHSYVNVDTTTEAGIQYAKELDLVQSGISDVISTPLLHDVVRDLFDASHKGRAFVVLRNPIDRAMATYHYLTTGRFHGPDGETLDQLSSKTLLEYAKSEFCDDNWLTRTLVNKPEGMLGKKDLNLAKDILRRKAIVGLYSDLATSLQHFVGVFGWDAPSSWNSCATDLIDRAYAREQEGFPRLDTDEPAFAQIQKKNKFDLELYDFAVQLRYQQLNALRQA